MKLNLFFFLIFMVTLWSCVSHQKNTNEQSVVFDADKAIQDTLTKYKVKNINDTCIKLLYGINAFKVISGSDSILAGMCKYKLVRIRQKNDSIVYVFYGLYYHDTIRMKIQFENEQNFHSFDINVKDMQIEKVFLGQEESYMKFNDYLSMFNEEIGGIKFKKNIAKYSSVLHPEFKRLLPF